MQLRGLEVAYVVCVSGTVAVGSQPGGRTTDDGMSGGRVWYYRRVKKRNEPKLSETKRNYPGTSKRN